MNAAEVARHFGIPAANIRQWIKRGHVHRHPDQTVDLNCLLSHLFRDTPTAGVATHDQNCHTRNSGTAITPG